MHDHQIGPGGDGQFDGGQRRIDARRDAPDRPEFSTCKPLTAPSQSQKVSGAAAFGSGGRCRPVSLSAWAHESKENGRWQCGEKIFATPY
jgi:hypothetical protein